MVIPGTVINTSLTFRTNMPNNKQNSRFAITDIDKQYLSNLLDNFDNSPYLGYKSKQVHNEPTEYYLLLTKYITKIIKTKRHVWIRTKGVKLGANEKIGHVNKTMVHVNKSIQSEYLLGIIVTTTCANQCKKTSITYDIKGKEKTLSTSGKKENSFGGYVCMCECSKHLSRSTYEHAFASQEMTISMTKEILDIYSSGIK